MAKERKYYPRFKEKFLKRDPAAYIYKIPDTGALGGKKPFDFFVVSKGIPFCVELKSAGEDLTMYQQFQMDRFKIAGGNSFKWIENDASLDELIELMLEVRDARIQRKGGPVSCQKHG